MTGGATTAAAASTALSVEADFFSQAQKGKAQRQDPSARPHDAMISPAITDQVRVRARRGRRLAPGRDPENKMRKAREGAPCATPLGLLGKNPGGVLLSHTATRAVPSAPKSLTSEFGMGSGVASSKSPPETVASAATAQSARSRVVRRA